MKARRSSKSRPEPASGLATAATWALGAAAALGAAGAGAALFSGWTARRVEAALPPQGRFIEIDGHRIHYLDVGSGPAIVMVHGLGGQMANFTYALVDQLKDRFRVVVMERPGAGYSDRAPGTSARLGLQADVVAGFMRALELQRPLVVGHSLGGALALAVAIQHPEAVSALALLSPLTQPQDEIPAAFRSLAVASPLARRLIAWTLAVPATMVGSRAVLAEIFGPEAPPADYATRGGGLLALRPRTYYSTSTDLLAVNDDLPGLAARYASLKLPVGVLFGADDRVLDAKAQGRVMTAQIDGVVYEEIAGAGHMIPITRAPEAAAFVQRVFERAKG